MNITKKTIKKKVGRKQKVTMQMRVTYKKTFRHRCHAKTTKRLYLANPIEFDGLSHTNYVTFFSPKKKNHYYTGYYNIYMQNTLNCILFTRVNSYSKQFSPPRNCRKAIGSMTTKRDKYPKIYDTCREISNITKLAPPHKHKFWSLSFCSEDGYIIINIIHNFPEQFWVLSTNFVFGFCFFFLEKSFIASI